MEILENMKRNVDEVGPSNAEVATKKLKSDAECESKVQDDGQESAEAKDSASTSRSTPFLTEIDVGIAEYVCGNRQKVTGVIKQRYSDFMVREIDLDGKLVKLDNLEAPEDPELEIAEPGKILSAETVAELKLLSTDEGSGKPLEIEVENETKDQRRLIHVLIAKLFPNLNTTTEIKDETKFIVVTKQDKRSDNMNFQRGQRQKWPVSRGGDYTYFALYKENIDTLQAINIIAKRLRMKPGAFTYAGVKDRRAKTVQMVSVYRTEGAKLLSQNDFLRNIVIGNVSYRKEPLRLGDLQGNRFQIVIRNACGKLEDISCAMQSLTENGFINYFGMQRFGTTSIPTYSVGLALLKSDWELAIELILKPRPEDETRNEFRKVWAATKNAKEAVRSLKDRNTVEAHLLTGLSKHGLRDCVNALNAIPRNQRLIYVHSYQSYVWNRVVSKRIQKYGLKTLKGDLKLAGRADDNGETDDTDSHITGKKVPTILQTDEDGRIEDVVVPLFGFDIIYPDNEIQTWYKEILKQDGLDINDIRRRVKDYSLPGSYRHIVVKPKDLNWAYGSYSDPTESLLTSDLDQILGRTSSQLEESTDGPFKGIKLEFSLPRSCYATMVLRELLQLDTSANFQKTLNAT